MGAATQNIGINISSNVSGALPGINSVSSALGNLTSISDGTARSIGATTVRLTQLADGSRVVARDMGRLTPPITSLSGSLGTLIGQARNGQLSLVGLNGSLTNLGRANTSLAGVGRAAGSAGTAIQNLGRVASDAPFGFIAIQNNLDPLIDSFSRLRASSGSTSGALRSLASSLAGPAGIALAFTVVSSAATFLIQKYGSLGNAFSALNPFVSKAAALQVQLNNAVLAGGQAAQEEVGNLQLLYTAATDVNIPLAERKKIVDQLQKQYPDTFKGLKDETILAGGASAAYDKLSQSLIAAATVKATEGLVTDQLKKLFELKLQAGQTQKVIDKLNAGDGSGLLGGPDAAAKASSIATIQAALLQNTNKQKNVEEDIAVIREEQLKIIKEYGSAALGISKIEPPKGPKVKEVKTDAEKIKDILTGLDADMLRLTVTFAATGGEAKKLAEDQIPILSNALSQLATLGAVPGTELFDSFKNRIKSLQDVIKLNVPKVKIPINIEPLPAASNASTIKSITDGIKQNFTHNLVDVGKLVNDTLKSQLAEGIASVAQGIGDAFAGGGLKSVLSGFIGAISSFGQSLGKQLIAQGVALIAFNASLKSLNGVTSIVAGAALVAASAAFKSFAGKGVSAFATGGTVFGPQLAMIGDNPGREEHIIPSEVLDKLGAGGGELRVSLEGSQFVVWYERQKRLNG